MTKIKSNSKKISIDPKDFIGTGGTGCKVFSGSYSYLNNNKEITKKAAAFKIFNNIDINNNLTLIMEEIKLNLILSKEKGVIELYDYLFGDSCVVFILELMEGDLQHYLNKFKSFDQDQI